MNKILIIKDEEKASEVLKAYLEKEGYELHCSTKGLKGVELFKAIDFKGCNRTIDVHIKKLTKKIEEDTRNPKYIVTVMKVGYKFGGGN